ncbi:hypothetical protein SDC9_41235 [bioreactor metagenome]|uniref:Uncharacterized protein n=1 Tax=bioreactor metagenome TaxID=1076179 RepID=A0A644VX66_9ZZZZ
MNKKNIGVNFDLRFSEIKDINSSFALVKVAICYAGANRNRSKISREVIEAAIPSLFYCPLVGRYDPETDNFGSHDIRVIKDKDGNMEIVSATVPFGVVYGGTQPYWETVTEADGTQREYLYCEVILWKSQYGYKCLASKDKWAQSMEIGVDSYIIDSENYCVIEKMEFEALCILGDAEPCFESASVQMNSGEAVSSYRQQFAMMIQEMKESEELKAMKFTFDNLKTEGGKDNLILTDEIRDSVLAEFELALEQLTFEITEDMDEAAFRVAIEEMKPAQSPVAVYESTYKQKREALENALDSVYVRNGDGEVIGATHYWVQDFDSSYAYVERYIWSADDSHEDNGRFKYSMSEADGVLTATIEGEFELMILQWLTVEENERLQQSRNAFEALSSEFEEYKKEYTVKDLDVEELRKFKKERLDADHKAVIDEVIEAFADIHENAEFIALTKDDKAYEFEKPEDLEKEFFAIRGKAVPVKFEKSNKKTSVKIPVRDDSEASKSRYGDLFERYGK